MYFHYEEVISVLTIYKQMALEISRLPWLWRTATWLLAIASAYLLKNISFLYRKILKQLETVKNNIPISTHLENDSVKVLSQMQTHTSLRALVSKCQGGKYQSLERLVSWNFRDSLLWGWHTHRGSLQREFWDALWPSPVLRHSRM